MLDQIEQYVYEKLKEQYDTGYQLINNFTKRDFNIPSFEERYKVTKSKSIKLVVKDCREIEKKKIKYIQFHYFEMTLRIDYNEKQRTFNIQTNTVECTRDGTIVPEKHMYCNDVKEDRVYDVIEFILNHIHGIQ